jgi:hypothetical protein
MIDSVGEAGYPPGVSVLMWRFLNLRALAFAAVVTALLVVAIVVGSRNLQNFDAALVAYLFGTIFAVFGIAYRYAVWLQRPPTWRYFVRTWELLFSRQFISSLALLGRDFLNRVVAQRFILHRAKNRWIGHMLMAWGCFFAFTVTIPLTFGWIQFGLKNGTIDTYETWVFGFRVFEFPLSTILAFNIFHVLDWCAVAVILGVGLLMRRRLREPGLIATQTFFDDWLPLILLMAIAITGLGLTLDYDFLQGRVHQFMAITHALTVILFLIWIPFGKFFHIVQRPLQLGVDLYRIRGASEEKAICPHNGTVFASKMHVEDLKIVTKQLGFDFELEEGGSHLDLSPQGKRARVAQAHLRERQKSGHYFG